MDINGLDISIADRVLISTNKNNAAVLPVFTQCPLRLKFLQTEASLKMDINGSNISIVDRVLIPSNKNNSAVLSVYLFSALCV